VQTYIETRSAELNECDEAHGKGESALVSSCRVTNIGVFRAFLLAYLREHPKIHQDMVLKVRDLPPTAKGLPLELSFFAKNKKLPRTRQCKVIFSNTSWQSWVSSICECSKTRQAPTCPIACPCVPPVSEDAGAGQYKPSFGAEN
jgi:hypothetical protein